MKLIPVLASVALAVCVSLPAAAQNVPYGYNPNSGYYPNQNYGHQGTQNFDQSSGLLGGVLGSVVSGLLRQTVVGGNGYGVPNGSYQQNYGNYQQYPQNYNPYQTYPNQGNYNPYGNQGYNSFGNQGYNSFGNQGYNPYAAQSGLNGGGLLGSILSAVLSQGLIR